MADSTDLEETRLAKLAAGDCIAGHVEAAWMAREILRRRAADLSGADREALRNIRSCARRHCTSVDCDASLTDLTVLDRLVGGGS